MRLRTLALVLVVGAFGLTVPQQAQAERVIKECRTNGMRVLGGAPTAYTDNASFTLARGLALRFTQRVHGCVIVELDMTGGAPDGGLLMVKPSIDSGDPVYFGREAQLILGNGTIPLTRTVRFVYPEIARGRHVLRIYFRSALGGQVSMGNATLIVQYMK